MVGEQERATGFSLIELLVVLAVMSLLTGIMLPVLGRVRRRARTLRGMTNQRQIVAGVNLYALDHDNRYPPSVASVGFGDGWNWGDPRKMTALFETTIGPHRAMSEYLGSYIRDATIMFCPNGPERYTYLQQAWDAGDAWDNPETWLREDAMNGTYCFWWNYTGLLDARLFKGPRNLLGGRGESELLVSDYLGFANWRNELRYGGTYFAYGSCEAFEDADVTPGEPTYAAGSAYWSRLKSGSFDLQTMELELHAGFADGHVELYAARDAVTLKVIKDRHSRRAYEYDEHGPGYFYIPMSASN